jgi:uncharacterized protein (UPF0332 family)
MNKLPAVKEIKKILSASKEKYELSKKEFDKSRFNEAASRAYYAVFHIMSALLLTKGGHFTSHKEVFDNFSKEFIESKIFAAQMRSDIESLLKHRHKRSYETDKKLESDESKFLISTACDIIEKCKEYLSGLYKENIN